MNIRTSYAIAASLALFFGGGMVGFDLAKSTAHTFLERDGEITFPVVFWSGRDKITYKLCPFEEINQ